MNTLKLMDPDHFIAHMQACAMTDMEHELLYRFERAHEQLEPIAQIFEGMDLDAVDTALKNLGDIANLARRVAD